MSRQSFILIIHGEIKNQHDSVWLKEYYSCVVIILCNTGLQKSAFSNNSFEKIIFRLSVSSACSLFWIWCYLSRLCNFCIKYQVLCHFVFTLKKLFVKSKQILHHKNSLVKTQNKKDASREVKIIASFKTITFWKLKDSNKRYQKIKLIYLEISQYTTVLFWTFVISITVLSWRQH